MATEFLTMPIWFWMVIAAVAFFIWSSREERYGDWVGVFSMPIYHRAYWLRRIGFSLICGALLLVGWETFHSGLFPFLTSPRLRLGFLGMVAVIAAGFEYQNREWYRGKVHVAMTRQAQYDRAMFI